MLPVYVIATLIVHSLSVIALFSFVFGLQRKMRERKQAIFAVPVLTTLIEENCEECGTDGVNFYITYQDVNQVLCNVCANRKIVEYLQGDKKQETEHRYVPANFQPGGSKK